MTLAANLVTKTDHDRPVLKLVDDIKRQRAETRVSKVRKWEPPAAIKLTGSIAKFEATLVGTRRSAMNVLIHHTACSVLAQAGKHHDIRLIDRLIAAVPDSVRRSRLRTWFTAFGPVEFVDGKAKHRRGAKTTLGDAMAKPFWRLKAKE